LVVVMVSVDVCDAVPLSVTEAGESAHVAGWFAAVGLMEQVRATVPLYPPEPGLMVMGTVLPVVEPEVTVKVDVVVVG